MKRTLCFRPYNGKNQLALQTVNGTPVEYAYTPEGWLAGKVLGGSLNPVSTLKYFYAPDGQVTGRSVDGKVQQYRYDAKGQLTAVLDADNKPVETYAYDPAGNILKKTVKGETTAYTYDGANQLVSSEEDGILTTRYRYDAAGRLVGEGGKSYRYGWLDKVVSVSEEGQVTASFGYHAGGQLAAATHGDKTESFLWDGLALIRRDGTDYVNEPHAGGGAPVLAGSYMQGQNIGNGMRSAAEIEALIVDAVAYARSEFMAESLASANTGVYLYCIGKPQWKILPPTIGYPFRRQRE